MSMRHATDTCVDTKRHKNHWVLRIRKYFVCNVQKISTQNDTLVYVCQSVTVVTVSFCANACVDNVSRWLGNTGTQWLRLHFDTHTPVGHVVLTQVTSACHAVSKFLFNTANEIFPYSKTSMIFAVSFCVNTCVGSVSYWHGLLSTYLFDG
jgi:hypothetical protein